LKKVHKLWTYAVMLHSLIVAYVQFVIMLVELKKVLGQELKGPLEEFLSQGGKKRNIWQKFLVFG